MVQFMKTSLLIVAASVALASLAPAAETELKDQKDKVSYSIGLEIGTTLKRQKIDVNAALLDKGIQDGLSGSKAAHDRGANESDDGDLSKGHDGKAGAPQKKATGEKNAAEGKKYLAENKTKAGVKTTADGLEYKVLKEGTGPTPKATDTVKVNYRGTTIDGTEFDSSYKRGSRRRFRSIASSKAGPKRFS